MQSLALAEDAFKAPRRLCPHGFRPTAFRSLFNGSKFFKLSLTLVLLLLFEESLNTESDEKLGASSLFSAASYLALDGCHIAEPKQYTILWTFRNFNRLLRTANLWTLWRFTSYNSAKEPTANNRI